MPPIEPGLGTVTFALASERMIERLPSLFSTGRAAERAGAGSKAETYYSQLLTMCKNAESERPELLSAKSFLEKRPSEIEGLTRTLRGHKPTPWPLLTGLTCGRNISAQ